MASAGQILSILNKLGEGLGKTQRQERGSRVKEAKQHKKLSLDLGALLSKAAGKGKKAAGLGNMLSMAAGLTGFGMPIVLALQLAGGYIGGKIGAGQSRDFAKTIKGFKGSKFGKELETYIEEVGSDVTGRAFQDTMTTALTMGAGAGLSKGASALAGDLGASKLMKTLGEIKIGEKTLSDVVKNVGNMPVGGDYKGTIADYDIITGAPIGGAADPAILKKVLSDITQNVKPQKFGKKVLSKIENFFGESGLTYAGQGTKKGLYSKLGIPKPLAELIASTSKKSPRVGERVLSSIYGGYKKEQQPSILEYESPESLSRPSGYGGYY